MNICARKNDGHISATRELQKIMRQRQPAVWRARTHVSRDRRLPRTTPAEGNGEMGERMELCCSIASVYLDVAGYATCSASGPINKYTVRYDLIPSKIIIFG